MRRKHVVTKAIVVVQHSKHVRTEIFFVPAQHELDIAHVDIPKKAEPQLVVVKTTPDTLDYKAFKLDSVPFWEWISSFMHISDWAVNSKDAVVYMPEDILQQSLRYKDMPASQQETIRERHRKRRSHKSKKSE